MRKIITSIPALCLGAGFMVSSAQAAIVSASYQGTIDFDSGLGLIGQTMQVDFSYDDQTSSAFPGYFEGYLVSMAVAIGSNTWNWDGVNGSSSVFLTNDKVLSFATGVEDRVSAFNDTFTGPDLVSGADGYNFSLFLSDNTPAGVPDALSSSLALPSVAFDPGLFNSPDGNAMTFAFFTGGGGDLGGSDYLISTANVSNVPLPPAAWMFGSAMLGIGIFTRRKSR